MRWIILSLLSLPLFPLGFRAITSNPISWPVVSALSWNLLIIFIVWDCYSHSSKKHLWGSVLIFIAALYYLWLPTAIYEAGFHESFDETGRVMGSGVISIALNKLGYIFGPKGPSATLTTLSTLLFVVAYKLYKTYKRDMPNKACMDSSRK